MAHQQRAIQTCHTVCEESSNTKNVNEFYIILDFEMVGGGIVPTDITYTGQRERALECFQVDCAEVVAVMVYHAPDGIDGPLVAVASSGPVPLPWRDCTIGMLEDLSRLKAKEDQ